MNHQGTRILTTERLRLRPFVREDAAAMYRNWAGDPQVTRFLTWQPHANAGATAQLLEAWTRDYDRSDVYNWAIELEGEAVGSIAVVASDDSNDKAELGYCLSRACWGRGIMTEAAGAVLDYLFGTVSYNRLSIKHALENPGSGRVAVKIGMRYEGCCRQDYRKSDGALVDVDLYAIIREDWERMKKNADRG